MTQTISWDYRKPTTGAFLLLCMSPCHLISIERSKPSLKKEKFQLLTNHFDINQSTFIKIKLGYKFSLINLVWPNCSLWFLSNQKYFKKDSKFPFKRSKFYEENFYVPTLTTLLYLGDNYKLIMYLFYTKNSPTISN